MTEIFSLRLSLYIYCYPQRDCFIVSQLFSVARHARFSKLGSKSDWLLRHVEILVHSHEEAQRNIYHFLFRLHIYMLNGYWELNSFEECCIMQVATINSLAWELNYISIYTDDDDIYMLSSSCTDNTKFPDSFTSLFYLIKFSYDQ